ncbi:SDR family NAD(P)-dependent oxidoreductase [Blastococcus sp. TF02A-26]|uniref:SDR family NAD(P)-dependent oxidoreductase n=1 Tax=Blastococcus sp. TF02A-26 TaxID=2250577 RepID=UPI0018F372DF|nr:SDR family oxidoreductase [Blastococcus sp. TF02A-26]
MRRTGSSPCVQAALPDMVAARWDRIVTVSSLAGQNGSPRQAHHSAAKGGVIALTKALSWEYARSGITANSIAPGPIDTPMSRQAQRAGDTAEEIVAACAYLCSGEAGFVSGRVLGANGGLHPGS